MSTSPGSLIAKRHSMLAPLAAEISGQLCAFLRPLSREQQTFDQRSVDFGF